MQYIKLIEDDGEVWFARWIEDEKCYGSDNPSYSYNSKTKESGVKLRITERMYHTFAELEKMEKCEIVTIGESEYWKQASEEMINSFDVDLAELENRIKDINKEKQAFLDSIGR